MRGRHTRQVRRKIEGRCCTGEVWIFFKRIELRRRERESGRKKKANLLWNAR